MADFDELIALLREPGDTELPDTIYDDLSNAHTSALDGGVAKVAQVESALADATAEIARLKALNFDLLMAASASTEPDDVVDDSDDVSDSVPSIDNLFDRS